MREKERYLCVMTLDMFYCVDLCKEDGPGIASVIESVRLLSSKLPVGMRSMEFPPGSRDFYLIGGEYQEPLPWRKSTYKTVKLSQDVYKVILQDDHHSKKIKLDGGSSSGSGSGSSCFLQKMDGGCFPMLNDGKAFPIIRQIGDKIYALHSRAFDFFFSDCTERPQTLFEVLEPYNGKWKWNPLPNPYPDSQSAMFDDGMVMADRWLYVLGNVVACYDTHTNEWHQGADARGNAGLIALGGRSPPQPLYKSEVDDYYVSLSFFLHPIAYVLNSKGHLLACQNLYPMFKKYNIVLPFSGHLIPLEGENRMCLVVATSDHISDYSVEILKASSETRLYVWFFSIQPVPGTLDTIHQIIDSKQEMDPYKPISDLHQEGLVSLSIEREFALTIPLSDPFDLSLIDPQHAFFL